MSIITKALNWCGYEIAKKLPFEESIAGVSNDDKEILKLCKDITMLSPERLLANIQAVRYIVDNSIPGSLVECGVWKGGSILSMLLTLIEKGDTKRDVYLIDTFHIRIFGSVIVIISLSFMSC